MYVCIVLPLKGENSTNTVRMVLIVGVGISKTRQTIPASINQDLHGLPDEIIKLVKPSYASGLVLMTC
jgi:hypothetical protein